MIIKTRIRLLEPNISSLVEPTAFRLRRMKTRGVSIDANDESRVETAWIGGRSSTILLSILVRSRCVIETDVASDDGDPIGTMTHNQIKGRDKAVGMKRAWFPADRCAIRGAWRSYVFRSFIREYVPCERTISCAR